MLRLGIALLVAAAFTGGLRVDPAHAGNGDAAEHDGDAAGGDVEEPAAKMSPARAGASQAKAKRPPKSKSRRASRSSAVGQVVPESKLRREPPPRPSGNVHMVSLNTREDVEVNIYNSDGSFNIEALSALSHLLRCKRTDTEKDIDPRLFVVLSHVHDRFAGKPIEIVSGYRNQRRTTSYHYRGSASDIRVPGVTPKQLRAFVETLDAGGMGIGLYPRSKFVHVDVRPLPSYRWVDWSPPEPNAPAKRPPAGFKKKRLQS